MSDKRIPIFVASGLDDLGLDPFEFRIYARIARRGRCTESIPSMAEGCKMGHNKVRKCLSRLLEIGLISEEKRDGLTTVYRPLPLPDQVGVRQEINGDTPTGSGSPPLPDEGGVPLPDPVDEGTPLEGTPVKVEKTPTSVGSKNGSEGHPITDDQPDTGSPSKPPSSKTKSPPRQPSKRKQRSKSEEYPTPESVVMDESLKAYCAEHAPKIDAVAFLEHFQNQVHAKDYTYANHRRAFYNWIKDEARKTDSRFRKRVGRYDHIPPPGTVVKYG